MLIVVRLRVFLNALRKGAQVFTQRHGVAVLTYRAGSDGTDGVASRPRGIGDALLMRVFQEAQSGGDVETIRPFDGHATVGAVEIALITVSHYYLIRPKCPGST